MEFYLDQELLHERQVVFTQRRQRMSLGLLGCLAFVALGVLLIYIGAWPLGVITIIFFGVIGIPAIVVQMIRPRTVTVTADSVEITGCPPLPWTATTGLRVFSTRGTDVGFIGLTAHGQAHITAHMNVARRLLHRANTRLLKEPGIALPHGLNIHVHQLLDWLALVRERAVR